MNGVPIVIHSGVVWGIFILVLLIVVVFGASFIFHWKYYGLEGDKKRGIKTLYFLGTVLLLSAAFILALTF